MHALYSGVRHRYNQAVFRSAARVLHSGPSAVEEGFCEDEGLVLLTVVSASLLAAHAFAGDYRAPRLPDGAPDLQDVWTNRDGHADGALAGAG